MCLCERSLGLPQPLPRSVQCTTVVDPSFKGKKTASAQMLKAFKARKNDGTPAFVAKCERCGLPAPEEAG
jgi:hypothetical protein